MIPKIYIIFLFIFFTIFRVKSFEISQIYNTTAVNNFLDNLMDKIERDSYFLDYKASNDTKNRILKNILTESVNELEVLNAVMEDPWNEYWYDFFKKLLKDFQESEIRKGSPRRAFMPLIARMEATWRVINSHVESLVQFHGSESVNNLTDLCPLIFGVKKFLDLDYQAKSIAIIYKNFIDNVFQEFSNEIFWKSCGQKTSLREGLFKFFRYVMTSYLKEFVMYWFVNVAHSRCISKNSPGMLGDLLRIFQTRYSQNLKVTKDTLQYFKFSMHRCDANAQEYYNRELYYELERMIQTVIVNEKDMSTPESCSHNCDVTLIAKINQEDCIEFQDCHLIEGTLDVCKTAEGYDSRRYQWFKDSKGNVYGNSSLPCYQRESLGSYYDGWKVRDCDYCQCTCIKRRKQGYHVVTAISLREQVSNTADNMVVVGVRFTKQDSMIHIQIKEGKLGPKKFNAYDPWKPLEDMTYDQNTDKFYLKNSSTPLLLGIDYWQPEIIYFDDLMAPPGFVVTGVRFGLAGNLLDSQQLKSVPIELQIRVTPVDYINRQIIDDHLSHWISPLPNDQRNELTLSEADHPTKSPENTIDSSRGQFIRFQASDLKKDAGQSTVPFFDAMEAEGFPGFPLGGVGLVHRGRKGFGGYLALRIYDLDLSNYFYDEESDLLVDL